jgi:hypothetical protein
MEYVDLRLNVPRDIAKRLMEGERVWYYASSRGVFAMDKSYFVITDSRVMTNSVIKNGGCLGGNKTFALDIPLEHISSVGTEKAGCLSSEGIVVVSSGTAVQRVKLSNAKIADEANMTLQKILRERRIEK